MGCRWFISRLAFALALHSAFASVAPAKRKHYEEYHKKGAVASESAVCSRIGIELIKKGGNAADAVGVLKAMLGRVDSSYPCSSWGLSSALA